VSTVGAVDLRSGHDQSAHVAEILAAGRTPPAPATGGQKRRDDVIADFEISHARADLFNHPGAFVTVDHRQRKPRQVAGANVVIGVAQSTDGKGDQHLALSGRIEVDLLDTPIVADLPRDCRVHRHRHR